MNEDDLTTLFLATAQTRAAQHGMRFGAGADHEIHRFAREGAQRILAQHPAAPGGVVRDARDAFERLIDEMVTAASQLDGYTAAHPGVIGEQTLARAMARLCPLFPIC